MNQWTLIKNACDRYYARCMPKETLMLILRGDYFHLQFTDEIQESIKAKSSDGDAHINWQIKPQFSTLNWNLILWKILKDTACGQWLHPSA